MFKIVVCFVLFIPSYFMLSFLLFAVYFCYFSPNLVVLLIEFWKFNFKNYIWLFDYVF